MTLIEATNRATAGHTIVSSVGKRYTPEMLAPISCGPNWAMFNTAGTTEKERKGLWKILKQETQETDETWR